MMRARLSVRTSGRQVADMAVGAQRAGDTGAVVRAVRGGQADGGQDPGRQWSLRQRLLTLEVTVGRVKR